MSSGASRISPEPASSVANLHENRSETLVPSLTREKLSNIIDEGLFERLAAGVLRIAERSGAAKPIDQKRNDKRCRSK